MSFPRKNTPNENVRLNTLRNYLLKKAGTENTLNSWNPFKCTKHKPQFLKDAKESIPLDYSQHNIIKVVNEIQTATGGKLWPTTGVCHGLTLYWAMKGEKAYYEIIKKVLTKTYEPLEYEKFVSQVHWLQLSTYRSRDFRSEYRDEKLKFQPRRVEITEWYDIDKLLELKLKAPMQEFSWDGDRLFNKFSTYLPNHEKVMILIGSYPNNEAHTMGLRCTGKSYFLFNVNDTESHPQTYHCIPSLYQPHDEILSHHDANNMINKIQRDLYDVFFDVKKINFSLSQMTMSLYEFQNPVPLKNNDPLKSIGTFSQKKSTPPPNTMLVPIRKNTP